VKPDFTGEWGLNRQASSLTGGASAMKSGVIWIEHRDPQCKFRINMSAGDQSVERAWESMADGKEVAGGGVVTRLFWDEDTLVFDAHSQNPDKAWTMSWRYELLDAGKRLRAVEEIRGGGHDQNNTWIFERR
jgi:hypothetical protein